MNQLANHEICLKSNWHFNVFFYLFACDHLNSPCQEETLSSRSFIDSLLVISVIHSKPLHQFIVMFLVHFNWLQMSCPLAKV